MIILDLGPPPARPLSLNEERNLHWAARRHRLHPWRDTTWALALAAGLRTQVAGRHATITAVLPVKGNYRRDPANFYPTVKSIVDGLVLANVWPDDTPDYVTVTEPILQAGGNAAVHLALRDDTT